MRGWVEGLGVKERDQAWNPAIMNPQACAPLADRVRAARGVPSVQSSVRLLLRAQGEPSAAVPHVSPLAALQQLGASLSLGGGGRPAASLGAAAAEQQQSTGPSGLGRSQSLAGSASVADQLAAQYAPSRPAGQQRLGRRPACRAARAARAGRRRRQHARQRRGPPTPRAASASQPAPRVQPPGRPCPPRRAAWAPPPARAPSASPAQWARGAAGQGTGQPSQDGASAGSRAAYGSGSSGGAAATQAAVVGSSQQAAAAGAGMGYNAGMPTSASSALGGLNGLVAGAMLLGRRLREDDVRAPFLLPDPPAHPPCSSAAPVPPLPHACEPPGASW